jgi:hypothetical protein
VLNILYFQCIKTRFVGPISQEIRTYLKLFSIFIKKKHSCFFVKKSSTSFANCKKVKAYRLQNRLVFAKIRVYTVVWGYLLAFYSMGKGR